MLIVNVKRHVDDAPLDQSKNRVGLPALALQKECRLGQDRFTRQKGRPQPLPLFAGPFMMPHAFHRTAARKLTSGPVSSRTTGPRFTAQTRPCILDRWRGLWVTL